MIDELTRAIEAVKANPNFSSYNEAQVKQGVILPWLRMLGWNDGNTDEVWPEFPVGLGNVDYCLCIGRKARVLIEAKRPENLKKHHEEQLLKYAFHQGIELAALTDGITWWLYLPMQPEPWQHRKFTSCDVREQEPRLIAERLVDFLCRENVKSGAALQSAQQAYRGQQLCISEKVGPPPPPSPPPPSSYLHKSPTGFSFRGQWEPVRSWKELLVRVCSNLYKHHKTDFDRVLDLRGTQLSWFSRNPSDLVAPKLIPGTDIFVSTRGGTQAQVRRCHRMLDLFGYDRSDLHIEAS